MIVVFGLTDGPAWPDPCRGKPLPGVAFVGREGLLSTLEEKLGLPELRECGGRRIAGYLRAMEGLITKGEKPFYAESFGNDRWGTAKRVLSMRDELKLNGVLEKADETDAPERIRTFLRIEEILRKGPGLSPVFSGTPDRCRRILTVLDRHGIHGISEIRLAAPRSAFEKPWLDLIDRLGRCGVKIADESARLESAEQHARVWELRTGSLPEAADLAAALLAAQDAPVRNAAVILRTGSAGELDSALARHGLARRDGPDRSTARAALQLLPLLLRHRLLPFSSEVYRQLLLLPVSPFRSISSAVLSDFRNTEAVPSSIPKFKTENKRKDEGESTAPEAPAEKEGKAGGGSAAKETIARKEEKFRKWLLKDAPESLSAKSVCAITEDLRDWAKKSRAWHRGEARRLSSPGSPDPAGAEKAARMARIYALIETTCEDLDGTVKAYGREDLDRDSLERLLEAALGAGTGLPAREAEPFPVLSDPSQLRGEVDTVVWWDFTRPGDLPRRSVTWKREEQYLAGLGFSPDGDAAARQKAVRWGWERIFHLAHSVILVTPENKDGEKAADHPHREKLSGIEQIGIDDLFTPDSKFLKPLGLKPVTKAKAAEPPAKEAWSQKAVDVDAEKIPGKALYATSIELLRKCRLRWYLEKKLRIGQNGTDLPNDSIVEGKLVHEVIEAFVKERCAGRPASTGMPAPAEAEVSAALHAAAAGVAARYREDARRPELDAMAPKVTAVLDRLFKLMREERLFFCESEEEKEVSLGTGSAGELKIGGKFDLALSKAPSASDASSEKISVIIDIKWCSDNRKSDYEKLLSEGSVQLETYRLVASAKGLADEGGIRVWYLFPRQGVILREEDAARPEAGRLDIVSEAARHIAKMREGVLSLPSEEDRGEACMYCAFASLCGTTGTADEQPEEED